MKRRFALDRGQAKRLAVDRSRKGEFSVWLDGAPLVPLDSTALRYRLPDGRSLVISPDSATGETYDLICDGEFVPGSNLDPHHQVFVSSLTLFLLAALHLVLPFLPFEALASLLRESPVPAGPVSLGLAAAYALAGFGTWRRKKAALGLGAAVAGLEGVGLSMLYLGVAAGGPAKFVLLFFLPLPAILVGLNGIEALAAEGRRA